LFLAKLAGITDPELKRKAIGATFIDVFDAEAHEIGGVEFLAQGRSPRRHRIGQRHRRPVGHDQVAPQCRRLPDRMKLALVEPLRELFKDEVRALGRELGLPEDFVDRHPFPGPAWQSASPAR